MTSPDPPRANAEALARRLQDSLRQRRFRTWRIVTLFAIAATVALAAIIWSLYSDRTEMPVLQVLAVDTFVNREETPKVRARLIAPELDAAPARVVGHDVFFLENRAPQPVAPLRQDKARSNARGYAEVSWPLPAGTETAAFRARYVDARRRKGSWDDGRVFVWPAASALLLVEVEGVLAELPAAPARDPLLAGPIGRAGAAEALQGLRDVVKVVYLTPATDSWRESRRLRGWVEAGFDSRLGFPPGPILGRADFAAATAKETRQAAVGSLRQHFKGQLVALVNHVEAVEVYHALRVATVVIPPEGPAWAMVAAEVRQKLAKND